MQNHAFTLAPQGKAGWPAGLGGIVSWISARLPALPVLVMAGIACTVLPRPLAAGEFSDADLGTVAARTVFFGHQSVGRNILEGVEETLKAHPAASWTIREIKGGADIAGPGLFHAEVGQNTDPLSKLEAFDRLVRAGVGERADVAFFKFCYIDFDKNSDVTALFARYKATLAALAQTYPNTAFVHVTVPLMAPERGVKALIKQAVGRYDAANAARHAFNQLIRSEYGASGRVFDLAGAEAAEPDGGQCTVSGSDGPIPCLASAYTDDGGHLNALGRKAVAPRFIAFLAGVK
jgi:hypothetical protein